MNTIDVAAPRVQAWFEKYADRVMAYAVRQVGPESAEDVVAETFAVACRRVADVPDEALPWLIVTARNIVRASRRAHLRRIEADEHLVVLERLASHPPGPEHEAIERAAIVEAMRSISVDDREVLLLVAWDGLTNAQGAEAVGCSAAAFQMRLSRARRRLEAAWAANDSDATEVQR